MNNNKLIHVVYKITNLIDGSYYIGKHSTTDLNDDYMGSGDLIELAIKKYGIENFRKDILFTFETEEEAYAKEAELVPLSECHDNSPKCYNLKPGGIYRTLTEDIKKTISNTLKEFSKKEGYRNPMQGKNIKDYMTPEAYNKWKDAHRGTTQYNNGEKEIFIREGVDEVPEGFVKGRLPSAIKKASEKQKGKIISKEAIEKAKTTRMSHGGFYRTPESIEKQMKTRKEKGLSFANSKGYMWCNNGKTEKTINKNEAIPEGFVKGRLKRNWYTDGKNNISIIKGENPPDGFHMGRTV